MNFPSLDSQQSGLKLRCTGGLRAWLRPAVAGALALCATLAAAQSPPGRVYVSSEKNNKIYVFDTQGQRLSAIDVCQRPRHMMFNATRSQLDRSTSIELVEFIHHPHQPLARALQRVQSSGSGSSSPCRNRAECRSGSMTSALVSW